MKFLSGLLQLSETGRQSHINISQVLRWLMYLPNLCKLPRAYCWIANGSFMVDYEVSSILISHKVVNYYCFGTNFRHRLICTVQCETPARDVIMFGRASNI